MNSVKLMMGHEDDPSEGNVFYRPGTSNPSFKLKDDRQLCHLTLSRNLASVLRKNVKSITVEGLGGGMRFPTGLDGKVSIKMPMFDHEGYYSLMSNNDRSMAVFVLNGVTLAFRYHPKIGKFTISLDHPCNVMVNGTSHYMVERITLE